MITFAIATLGCKVNAYESEGYVEGLKKLGYIEVDFKAKADVYIINTCAVTNTAASKSKQKIHHAKKMNPQAIVCVVGCLIQTNPEEEYDVDIRIGSSGKKELPMRIQEALNGVFRANTIANINAAHAFESLPIQAFSKQTRAYLKVQDGCNQFCSYCIIPFARGRERSLPLEEALTTARQLVSNGHKEIVLSGIHTGRYGHDIGSDLLKLMKAMVEIEGLERIRVSSIEMNEINDELLLFMKEQSKVAKHLHIPIQSGCNRILKAMNRPYSVEQFKEKIAYIRSLMPSISISTDIILGFPDEREEDFIETLHNVETLKFSFMHVFPFSKRDGTKACEIPNHINNKEKKERCKKVSLLSKKHYNMYKRSFLGKEVDVLFEYEKDGYVFGHSSEYLPVKAKVKKEYVNTLCKVKITRLENDLLYND